MTDLAIIDLHDATGDQELVERTYHAVLRPSFTSDELSGVHAVRPGPQRLLTVAVNDERAPLGAAVTELEPDGVSLLAYLAVAAAARNLGAGARLVAHLRQNWRAAGYPLVLAEVHDPRGHAEAEHERPQARLRFYGRAGAEVLDVPWVQPALDGGSRVSDMLLLALHRSEGPAQVPSAPLLAWAEEYFVESEGRVPDDPQASALLQRIGARDVIALLSMDDWRQVQRLSVS